MGKSRCFFVIRAGGLGNLATSTSRFVDLELLCRDFVASSFSFEKKIVLFDTAARIDYLYVRLMSSRSFYRRGFDVELLPRDFVASSVFFEKKSYLSLLRAE
jgi:hypothetical protein